MASEKQNAANRLNAQLCRGPVTEAGKAKSRMNAKRDGITGQVLTLSEEERPVFEQLKAELIADLAPKTVMEIRLANSIAWDTWRLDHLRAVEMNLYALGVEDPETDPECDSPELHTAMSGALTFNKHSDRFALMSIYEQRLNRSIHKNLTTLRELKAEREKLYKKDLENEVLLAQANDSNGLPYQAPTRKSQNGFVFSTAEVLATANRRSVLYNALATKKPTKERVQFAGAWEAYEEPSPNKPNSGLKMAVAA